MNELKTRTLGHDDNPTMSYLRGRHSNKAFNKAFSNEWGDSDDCEIEYVWLRFTKKAIKHSDVNDLKAVLCTVTYW